MAMGTSRYPGFKSKKRAKKSYTTNTVYSKSKGNIACNILLDEAAGTLKFPNHKDPVKLNLHRSIRAGGKLKSVAVTLEPDGKTYYTLLMEYPKPAVIKAASKKAIGLVMSLPKFYVDSTGQPGSTITLLSRI